jgi:hypothetical protein
LNNFYLSTEQRQPLGNNLQDTWIMKFMAQAEKKCRKLKMGSVQWTPTFAKLCLDIKVVSLMLNSKVPDHQRRAKIQMANTYNA